MLTFKIPCKVGTNLTSQTYINIDVGILLVKTDKPTKFDEFIRLTELSDKMYPFYNIYKLLCWKVNSYLLERLPPIIKIHA